MNRWGSCFNDVTWEKRFKAKIRLNGVVCMEINKNYSELLRE